MSERAGRPTRKKVALVTLFMVAATGGVLLAGIGGVAQGVIRHDTTKPCHGGSCTTTTQGGGGGTVPDCPEGQARDNSGNCVDTTPASPQCPEGSAPNEFGDCIDTTGGGEQPAPPPDNDMSIDKFGRTTAKFGSKVTFTVNATSTNTPLPPGSEVTIEERVYPKGFVSIGGPGWNCEQRGTITGRGPRGPTSFARIFCTYRVGDAEIDTLPPLRVTETMLYPGYFSNCAYVGRTDPNSPRAGTNNPSTYPDPDATNNRDCARVFIPRPPCRLVTRLARIPCTGPYANGNGSGNGTGGTGGGGGNPGGGTGGGGNPGGGTGGTGRGNGGLGFGSGNGFPYGGNPPPNSTFGIDHFECYVVTAGAGSPSRDLSITDQFNRVPFKTRNSAPDRLCTPASVNEGLGALGFRGAAGKNGTHLLCYRVSGKTSGQMVKTADQLGYNTIRLLATERVCLATAKTRQRQSKAPAVPTNMGSYLCYSVSALDRPARRFTNVNLEDQFWATRSGIVVVRPSDFCSPARVTATGVGTSGVPDSRDQLLCYDVTLRTPFPGATAYATNAYDSQRQNTIARGTEAVNRLCLPALIRVLG